MLRLITRPASEPVSLAEAKLYLRVDIADDDALISSQIASARQLAETALNRSLIHQTWDLILDGWPGSCDRGRSLERPASIGGGEIRIPNPDLVSVNSITYIDPNGSSQVLDPSSYLVIPGAPGRICPAVGRSWPAVSRRPAAITIRYLAGYGPDASAVPECVKSWILIQVAGWYENREPTVTGTIITPVPGVDSLLDPELWGAYS